MYDIHMTSFMEFGDLEKTNQAEMAKIIQTPNIPNLKGKSKPIQRCSQCDYTEHSFDIFLL